MARDAVVIMMADENDDCRDVVRYWKALGEGRDCVFSSRFIKREGGIIDYPRLDWRLNRPANPFYRQLFGTRLSDTTNVFKIHRRTGLATLLIEEKRAAPWLSSPLYDSQKNILAAAITDGGALQPLKHGLQPTHPSSGRSRFPHETFIETE